jgi:hypothetical protein
VRVSKLLIGVGAVLCSGWCSAVVCFAQQPPLRPVPPASAPAEPLLPQREVFVFPYQGADDDESKAGDHFWFHVRRELRGLHAGTTSVQLPRPPDRRKRAEYQQFTGALALVDGRVMATPPVFVLSHEVFLGALKGPLADPELDIDVPFSIEGYVAGKDGLFAALLFALARDEMRSHAPRHVVAGHLGRALNAVRDAQESGPTQATVASLRLLEQAIRQSGRELGLEL